MPKMRRFTAYVAASVASTTALVAWALIDRPNFYSAAVWLSQSSACMLVITNFAMLSWFLFVWGLQRLFFGPLRLLEVETLYERGWIVMTEWLFAMSTFRGEFGVETAMLFLLLLVGKAWGWICEGRIDSLDHQFQLQQTQTTGRFAWVRNQGRLMGAVVFYLWFVSKALWYCAEEVMLQARMGVMMMFVFEWAILLMTSTQIACKYCLWGVEQVVLKKQQKERIEALRREAAEVAAAENPGQPVVLERIPEEDLDVHDLDLPGWEAKSQYSFILDISVDFLRMVAYAIFFAVLTVFYGLPFYIVRDLFMSVRSFLKRINDYVRYQRATRNMNSRYPDATIVELSEDNTCIICREEMYPWHQLPRIPQPPEGTEAPLEDIAQPQPPQQYSTSEKQRPKKLPCGHILHFSCLRSWLERQQTCPTCRRSVLENTGAAVVNRANGAARPPGLNGVGGAQADPHLRNAVDGDRGQPGNNNEGQPRQGLINLRVGGFNLVLGGGFGVNRVPWERMRDALNRNGAAIPPVGFGGNLQNEAHQQGEGQGVAQQHPPEQDQPQPVPTPTAQGANIVFNATLGNQTRQAAGLPPLPSPHPALEALRPLLQSHIVHTQLTAIEHHLSLEVQSMQNAMNRSYALRQAVAELERIRQEQRQLDARALQITLSASPDQQQQPQAATQTQGGPTTPLNTQGRTVINLPPGYQLVPLVAPNQPQGAAEGAGVEPTPTTTTGIETALPAASRTQRPASTPPFRVAPANSTAQPQRQPTQQVNVEGADGAQQPMHVLSMHPVTIPGQGGAAIAGWAVQGWIPQPLMPGQEPRPAQPPSVVQLQMPQTTQPHMPQAPLQQTITNPVPQMDNSRTVPPRVQPFRSAANPFLPTTPGPFTPRETGQTSGEGARVLSNPLMGQSSTVDNTSTTGEQGANGRASSTSQSIGSQSIGTESSRAWTGDAAAGHAGPGYVIRGPLDFPLNGPSTETPATFATIANFENLRETGGEASGSSVLLGGQPSWSFEPSEAVNGDSGPALRESDTGGERGEYMGANGSASASASSSSAQAESSNSGNLQPTVEDLPESET